MNAGREEEAIPVKAIEDPPGLTVSGEASAPEDVLSIDELEAAASTALQRGEWAAKQTEHFSRMAEAAHDEARLLSDLIALRRGHQSGSPGARVDRSAFGSGGGGVEVNGGHPSTSPEAAPKVTDVAVRVLEDAGKPMHISQVMFAVKEAGAPIPGAGTQANLISHLRRDSRIVRPSRGLYGLRAWGLEEFKPVRRKSIPKKRKRRSQARKTR